MRDVFYTILTVWVIWRVLDSITTYRTKQNTNNSSKTNVHREGVTSIDHIPPIKKKFRDEEGEYVDYEELK